MIVNELIALKLFNITAKDKVPNYMGNIKEAEKILHQMSLLGYIFHMRILPTHNKHGLLQCRCQFSWSTGNGESTGVSYGPDSISAAISQTTQMLILENPCNHF